MQIDATQKRVSLSVGEFATFRPYAIPGFGGVSAAWRAQLGTQWHQRIQADSAAGGEGMQDEVPIAGELSWRGWSLRLTGRIDQLKAEGEAIHLREIKTVNQPLPLSRETLLEQYLSYPVQLLAYRELLLQNPGQRQGANTTSHPKPQDDYRLELLFVEIGSGLTQSLVLDSSYDGLLVDQLDALVDYLEAKQERLAKLRALIVNPVYPTPRPGQENIQQELSEAFAASNITLLEAPTGYGKTGVAWEHAARRLADGQAERVLYLTSKSTGQTEAVERLRSLLATARSSHDIEAPPAPASFWQIRNKQEHCINTEFRCSRQTCPHLHDLHEKWKRAGLQRLYLLSHDELTLDQLKAEGRAIGICPYEIMRAGLGYRDIWIADYNYLFSPHSARLLEDQNDFDPARTFLIVDEAHNLPSRVASAFTYDFGIHQLYAAVDDLRETRSATRLQNLLKSLASIVASLPSPRARGREAEIPNHLEEDFQEHLASIAELLASEPLPYEELTPETGDLLFSLAAAHAGQKRGELRHLLWSPADGAARLECIDASRLVQSQLSRYAGVLALSATLSPVDAYLEEIGLAAPPLACAPSRNQLATQLEAFAEPVSHLRPPAPWRENAYQVAIDLRVDTRLKTRQSHLPTTAATIAAAAESAAPAIVFFPSYAYAEAALAALSQTHPFVRAALQPRAGGSLAERAAYLEQALAFNDALFLILGSSYAEGVDTLGGKAGCAIVVSPALPEMNLIQEAKRRRYDNQSRNGFERAYLQPGIQKVNQALGRLVRSPDHQVKALLHCQRFAEPQTRRLLDPLYQTKTYLHNDADLAAWLQSD